MELVTRDKDKIFSYIDKEDGQKLTLQEIKDIETKNNIILLSIKQISPTVTRYGFKKKDQL